MTKERDALDDWLPEEERSVTFTGSQAYAMLSMLDAVDEMSRKKIAELEEDDDTVDEILGSAYDDYAFLQGLRARFEEAE
jgi:hypothetical protein